jgi:hypothetical protein
MISSNFIFREVAFLKEVKEVAELMIQNSDRRTATVSMKG